MLHLPAFAPPARWALVFLPLLALAGVWSAPAVGEPLRVCVSTTDVRAIVRAVGGDAVQVTGFVEGPSNPHVIQPSRSMIEALARAELLVVTGLGLEQAWLPGMVETSRNARVRAGGEGYLDLSDNMRTIAGPEGRGVPTSFHPVDNPHYLVDPVEGVKAARAVADELAALRPALAQGFNERFEAFAAEVMTAMLGPAMAQAHAPEDFEALCVAIERGELEQFVQAHGEMPPEAAQLGGWLGKFAAFRDTPVVGDHDLWPYFARRYGVRVLGYMEPEPGVPPTVPHLTALMAKMKEADCRTILTIPYFDPRHARFMAHSTDATVVALVNLPEALPGTESYLDFTHHNAQRLYDALESLAVSP